jgi:hypothetical protein
MEYQVKHQPKVVYEAITHEFTLIDESGNELEIRKFEDDKTLEFHIWNKDKNMWQEFYPDRNLRDFILDDLDY